MNILKDGDRIKRIFDIWEEIRQDGVGDGRQSVRDQIIEAKAETAKAKAMLKQQVERKAEAMRTALRLLMDGISIFKTAQYTGLSVQEVRDCMKLFLEDKSLFRISACADGAVSFFARCSQNRRQYFVYYSNPNNQQDTKHDLNQPMQSDG